MKKFTVLLFTVAFFAFLGNSRAQSDSSNPTVIGVTPTSFYEVMNPDMIVKRTDPVSAGLAPIPNNPNFKPESFNLNAKGSTAWGFEAINNNYVTFDTDDPYTFNSILSSTSWAAYAGDFVTGDDTKLYINNFNDSTFGTVDVASGVYTEIGSVPFQYYNDFACDKTTGILYGIENNVLYTINTTTAQETFVGNLGNTGGIMVAIAVDGTGNMWGHDLVLDEIWAINKTTGAGVSVGPTGFDANYAQSMSWDPISNTVYLAAFNNSNFNFEFRSVNLVTGATTLIGAGLYFNEVTILGFPALAPHGDGESCESAIGYTVVDDAPVYGSTTYTGDFVWYSVENPEIQDFYVSLCGSDFDTKVAIYESCDDWNGELPDWYDYAGAIAYNDDSYACDGGEYSLQSLTHVNWAAPGTFYVLVWGFGGEYGDYELKIHGDQSKLTHNGWGSLSTYVDLDTKGTSVEVIFANVEQQMTILLQDMGIYWPGYNLNTIGDYDTYAGCKVKWNDETTWIVEGDIVEDVSVTFPAGTYYLPVLSKAPVEAQDFITVPAVEFMFDIDNGLIYWPEGGIIPGVGGSLEYLFPGSAYMFKCTEEITFDFEPSPADYAVSIPQDYFKTLENNTTWNDVLKTGDHHFVGFSRSALDVLEPGDYIGVFNADGICTGMQLYAGKESALAMPVNGNDATTQEVDGMTDQEFLNFRIYRDGQIYDVNAVYNPAMPNYDGLFNINGLSQVTDLKFGPLSIEENPISSVKIYPNPSSGVFNIDLVGFENTVMMEVLNSRGQLIYKTELNVSQQLDLTEQPRGVYFIRLFNSTSVHLEKIVVK